MADTEYFVVEPVSYKRHGWKKDKPDTRDYKFASKKNTSLPRIYTLRDSMPPVLDQGQLGSCTANGIANSLVFCEMKENIDNNKPRSRLFIYYNERDMEGEINSDAGGQIRDGVKSVNTVGACFEETWPYDIKLFTEKPPQTAYDEASRHVSVKYEAVNQTENDLKTALQSGYPVVFGFSVFQSIESPDVKQTGVIPLPKVGDSSIGGHCVLLTGWDDSKRLFQIQNSWGTDWGDKGFGYLSYDYVLNTTNASDFWLVSYTK